MRVSGRPLCVHTSLRSFGEPLHDGALTLIEGLLEAGCTVMVPTFCDEPEAMPPAGTKMPHQNGWSEAEAAITITRTSQPYASDTPMINQHMGALPKALLSMPERKRSSHPLNSFAAVGPLAATLIEGQTLTDVYAPFRALIETDGAVLLRRWAMDQSGEIVETHIGSCSEGFPNLEPQLGPLASETRVGASLWRAFPAGETALRVRDVIREHPEITHCGRPACKICDDMLLGGPLVDR